MGSRGTARATVCAALLAACGQGASTGDHQSPGIDVSKISLTYVCENRFRIQNSSAAAVTVNWKVENSGDQGTVDLPAPPGNQVFSETFFSTRAIGTVVLSAGTTRIASVANSQTPCTTQNFPLVQVAVTPTAASVAPGGTLQISAQVTGDPDTAVRWSVKERNGGSVDATGVYTAPQTTGTFHVIATSHADPSRTATATVTVRPGAVQVVVRPAAVTLAVNGTRRLAAQVSGNPDTAVLWSVSEGNSGGTVDPTGLYTAPATVGTFHVVATSHADPAISATATVTVQLTPPPVLGQWDPVETWPVVPNQGGLYIDIVPLRDALGRYGLTVGDVDRTIESAIGGAPIGVTVEGAHPLSIDARYPQDARSDLERLHRVLVPLAAAAGAATPASAEPVAVAQNDPDHAQHPSDGTPPLRPVGGRSAVQWQSVDPAALQGLTGEGVTTAAKRGFVSLGQVADIRIVGGPPMVRDEGGLLVGYVFVDVDPSQRDLGGYVSEAKQVVQAALADGRLKMPQGYFLKWTGQYEELEKMATRMRLIVPAALLLIVVLLFLHFQNLIEVLIVLLSVPFALAGSVWLLWLLDYPLSTGVL